MKKVALMLLVLIAICSLMVGCNLTPSCTHNFELVIITPATDTINGVGQITCSLCGFTQNIVVPASGQEPTPPHTCQSICETCGKCTDTTCAETVCADKCQGHEPAPVHTCESLCPTCGLCLDNTCAETVCADKCQGHEPAPVHTCESICPTCGLCLDNTCAETVCADKCQGHQPPHTCESFCETCGKCADTTCAETVCADKCQGHSAKGEQLTANFTDANQTQLYTDNSKLTFTSNISAYGYDSAKGAVQFTQKSGTAVITSSQTLTDVSNVTVTVQTNQSLGMTVSVKVGATTLSTDNGLVLKDDGEVDLLFTSDTGAVSGKLVITLQPHGSDKSMYIASVDVNGSSGGSQGGSQGGSATVMPNQQYNASTFDNRNLQELMTTFDFGNGDVGESIGLLSQGTYNALVIPVAFTNYSFTTQELANLEIAFNGTSAQTGWESVKTYYQKSSYGKLNITFDITDVFTAPNASSYYDNSNYGSGSEQLLIEALDYFDGKIDYNKYDVDNDGCIDAVYLIYAAPVEYVDDSSEYWAFVSWSYAEDTFDNLYPYYYLFAGKDFMLEATDSSLCPDDQVIDGMKVNASTYIHETGHLLSLDDYYDYDSSTGSNQGLGCADMMDSTVGDHNSYSKIMLGWLTPTIVTTSGTYTIDALSENASCLLIPLDFNNSYFCEYLLVDLYADSGLNDLHGGFEGSLLYDIATYGVRIYHVSSWVTDPYNNNYQSYTDNNNTSSDIALIRLVEADGTVGFADSVQEFDYQYAMDDDLWQAGDSLKTVFPNFARYDNKLVNFDITVTSVSASQATITVTFDN